MGLRDRLAIFREAWAATGQTQPVMGARVIPWFAANRALTKPHDYEKFAEEGYRQNLVIAACVWAIGTSAAEPRFVVEQRKGNDKDPKHGWELVGSNHPLQTLIDNPNPEQSTYEFFENIFTMQQVMGNWMVRKVRAKVGRVPVQLWSMRPDKIGILPDQYGLVNGYVYDPDGKKIPIPLEDLIHDKFHPDPLNEFWGLSPIAVLARMGDLDNLAVDFMRAFFTNDGTPAGLLKLRAKTQPGDRQRLKELWQKENTGQNGWQTISVIDADADFQAIGADPGKMVLEKLFDRTEARICAAYGVPAIVAGQVIGLNRSTFANYKEARQSFWKDTLVTLYKRCTTRLTKGLAAEFGPNLRIRADLSTVEALQEDLSLLEERVIAKFEANLITFGEARQELGMEVVGSERDDQYFSELATPPSLPGEGEEDEQSGAATLLQNTGNAEDDEAETQQRRLVHERHKQQLTPSQKRAMRQLKKVVSTHFSKQSAALIEALK